MMLIGESESSGYEVLPINRNRCDSYILDIHYAKRYPSVSWCFGLFKCGDLCGVVTYGTPSSSTLRAGIAGEKYQSDVIELNRLCLKNNLKNEASMLVGRSLKLIDRPKIVVSYSDTSQNHIGIVYQACNFIYTGLSAKRTDWKVKGKEHLHGQTIGDEFRGFVNRAEKMREKYGDDFYLEDRPRKHRYIFVASDRRYKKQFLKSLRYDIKKYPKLKTSG